MKEGKIKGKAEPFNSTSTKKKKAKPIVYIDPSLPAVIRLNRYIALSGLCSRREADRLIQNGVVTVNDKVVKELGTKVNRFKDVVKVRGKIIKPEPMIYILLNKPRNVICTVRDERNRRTVIDLVRNATNVRVYPVGRLDRNTTGVILLTNDGELARRLMHPSFQIPKIYRVRLDRPLTEEDYIKVKKGVTLEDGFFRPDDFYYEPDNDAYVMKIHSGRNRIIRRLFAHLGYEVKRLDRLAFAHLTKKGLKRGEWRFLSQKEIGYLKILTGSKRVRHLSNE